MTHAERFDAFTTAVTARLEQGTALYSFQAAPDELAGEIEQELLDVCAWSFILWCRLRALREAVREVRE